MEKSIQEEVVERAVETYDHLLWQSIINICGVALSKAFERKENSVRVVYEIRDMGLNFWREKPFYLDPRGRLDLIKKEVEHFISSALPIQKEMSSWRFSREANAMCSNWCYNHFLFDVASEELASLSKCKPEVTENSEDTDIMWELFMQNDMPAIERRELILCSFVRIGWPSLPGCICCPCVGQHLENTRDLAAFKIKLQEPKKIGKDTYEFRFEVSIK